MTTPPSGEQYELRDAGQRVVVTEVGATLREYSAGERELIDGFPLAERADGARGMALIPWPNRIRDGRYEWDGEEHQLDLTEVPRHNAIHGLVRWRSWQPVERSDDRIVLATRVFPMPGYPFTLDLSIVYQLAHDGLHVTTRAQNLGTRACPYGVGFHPYLTLGGGGPIDPYLLRVPAGRRMILDERGIPTSSEPVAGGTYDFREPRAIGALALDDCFCELQRDADGRARVILTDGHSRVALWLGKSYGYLMIYSGDALAAERRRRGLGVEPMSCAPNAFASRDGLVRLEPGDAHIAEWGIEP